MNIWQILTKPAPSITDTRQVRNARLLSIFSLSLILIFLIFMVVNAATVDGYRVPPADIIGYAFLFIIYFSSRTRYYLIGIAMIIAMMPVNTFANILQGTTPNPGNTINFLVITYVLAGIFLSTEWTAVISFIIVVTIWFLPNLAPDTIADLSVIIQPFTVNIITALLVVVSMNHRNRIEQARREEIRILNESLEKRVEERTAELAAVNKEVESFSYSVSHDLRAPLRAIKGFSDTLYDEYGDTFNEEAKEYFHSIQTSADKMDLLINDILKLSRLGRRELTKETFDIAAAAKRIFDELVKLDEGNPIEFHAADCPMVNADMALVQIMLNNLISNAIKFTHAKEKRVIEFGCNFENGNEIFFMKDNGIGFDMAYGEKAFEIFQRLHSQEEFEGTGVGLAIVRQVVHRHGGKIWAEAKPDQGATFFFTLKPS